MKAKIRHLMQSRQICCVYTNVDATDVFAVGYIIAFDETYFLMESIDRYGNYDGVFCTLAENIIKIETESRYAGSIEKLFLSRKQKLKYLCKHQDAIVFDIINHIMKNKKICSIKLCNSANIDAVGFIAAFDEETLEMNIIDQYGDPDGKQEIVIDDISHVSCDSMDDNKIETLYHLWSD